MAASCRRGGALKRVLTHLQRVLYTTFFTLSNFLKLGMTFIKLAWPVDFIHS